MIQDHWIWLSNFDSMPISWNTVIFKFHLIFLIDERRIVSGKAFHMVFWWSPLISTISHKPAFRLHCFFCWHRSMGFPKTPYEKPFPTQFFAHRSQNQVIFENDCVSRNRHRIKITQPNSKILVSFSSVEDALFKEVKNDTFRSQGTENLLFRLFWDTRYRLHTYIHKHTHAFLLCVCLSVCVRLVYCVCVYVY